MPEFDIFFDKNRRGIMSGSSVKYDLVCLYESGFYDEHKPTYYASTSVFSECSPERYPNEVGRISEDVI